jgi:hypothetical protein
MLRNLTIFVLLLLCGGLFHMWKINQQALECSSYVNEGIDLTGKGRNNCTDPDSIP